MKGYKAFNPDLTCRDYHFTTDNTHTFDDEPILCVKGFHFCATLEDVVKYYCSPDMRVFEIEASGMITNAKDDCSKRACSEIKLVKEISLDEVMLSITKSEPAYRWARGIGNKDIMIDKITESKWAYRWARSVGNGDIMIDKITESKWAYYWATDIGNQDIMVDRITDSKWAYRWAMYIGNQDIMKSRVTEPYWINIWWNCSFPYNKIN